MRKERVKHVFMHISLKALYTSSPHIVQVVSMLDVPTMLGSVSFQSNDVRGAQNSEFRFYTVGIGYIYDLHTSTCTELHAYIQVTNLLKLKGPHSHY